jgi:hypothetical protein
MGICLSYLNGGHPPVVTNTKQSIPLPRQANSQSQVSDPLDAEIHAHLPELLCDAVLEAKLRDIYWREMLCGRWWMEVEKDCRTKGLLGDPEFQGKSARNRGSPVRSGGL